MRKRKRKRHFGASTLLAALCMAAAVVRAGEPSRPAAPVARPAADVMLSADGTLSGQLVDAQGAPTAKARLTALPSGRQQFVATTDAHGRFRLKDITPGVYTIAYGDRSVLLRVWRAEAAPPSARPEVLLVDGPVTRGQLGDINPLASSLTAQTFAGGVLVAAIAVPLAIGLNDDPSGS